MRGVGASATPTPLCDQAHQPRGRIRFQSGVAAFRRPCHRSPKALRAEDRLSGSPREAPSEYHDDATYCSLALVDFGLDDAQLQSLVREALGLVATRARYSIRELLGTAIAMKRPGLRGEENRMAREHSFFCSAFVRHVYGKAGIDLLPGVDVKNTTPEDLARSPLPFRMWLLERGVPVPLLASVTGRVRRKIAVRSRARRIARGGGG